MVIPAELAAAPEQSKASEDAPGFGCMAIVSIRLNLKNVKTIICVNLKNVKPKVMTAWRPRDVQEKDLR